MKILIAVPTYENIYPDVFKSIYDLDKCGHEVVFEFIRGYDCAAARNRIADKAIEIKADYVLMIDNDTVIPKNTLKCLIEDNKEVVFGYYAHRGKDNKYNGLTCMCKLGEFDYTQQFNENELYDLNQKGKNLVQIHGGGMGCAFIKTKVFERFNYPYFKWVNYKNKCVLSEDLYFCEQCKNAGIKIYVDTRIKCGHIFRYTQEVK